MKYYHFFEEYGTVLIGGLMAAIAINGFLVPHSMLVGGAAGIAVIVYYLTKIPSGISLLVLNIPIFILAYKHINKKFVLTSLLGMLSLSLSLIITNNLETANLLDDPLLAAIFGGALNGLGVGLVFKKNGSLGGLDMIAVILKKYLSFNLGSILFSVNIIIVGISAFLFGLKPGLLTIISMYIGYGVVDKVQEGFDHKKMVFIVTDQPEEIAQGIIQDLCRGVTFFYGEGAYTHHDKKVLYCVVTTRQLAKLKIIINSVDPSAFFTISDAAEVSGSGFKSVSC